MGDGFKRKVSAIAHRPMGVTYPAYPPPSPPGYPPPAPPFYPPISPTTAFPPSVSPPPYNPAYSPICYSQLPNQAYLPVSYPQIPNQVYLPPMTYPPVALPPAESSGDSRGGNQANPPAANQPAEENTTQPNRENEANTSIMQPSVASQISCPQVVYAVANQFVLVSQLVVIGPQFCFPYPVDVTIARKIMAVSEGNFGVTDSQGNVMFTVRGKLFSTRDRRVLLDAYGNPLVSLQQKIITAHRRWQIFKGDSSDSRDLLFSVRKSSIVQLFGTGLDVYLAHNTTEHKSDYKVKGSYFDKSCTIYSRANTVIAQMHKTQWFESALVGKDSFQVTVYPNVDHAFVVALVVVLEEINADKNGKD